jgi:uncharacterized protein (TIGR03083 family)
MVDFIDAVTAESNRFAAALKAAGDEDLLSSAMVPTCPEWTMADLAWHLTEVQHFWAEIVDGNLANPSAVESLTRPADAELADGFAATAERLVAVIESRGTAEPCWSWHDDGGSVGWVRRRQAHEALIHRVDAELTLAAARGEQPASTLSPIDEELAADGVDEMLRVMLDASSTPDWARFDPDGSSMQIRVPGRGWTLHFGRFVGTDPSGDDHDLDAISVEDPANDSSFDGTVLEGPASEVDLWLWRRDPLDPVTTTTATTTTTVTVDGDQGLADRLRSMADMQ